ncbi:MAG: CRISPR-associated protein Cas2 [Campylobacterota bacterium]|nr:CRISPR-associated protein Cas2 [Campylobacterota bacterium]
MFAILIYDISQHPDKKKKNITKVRKTVEQYLHRVQYSVFEGEIQPHLLKALTFELKKLIDKEFDSIIIYSFNDRKYSEKLEMGVKREHNMFS